jgi:hypothetical protein
MASVKHKASAAFASHVRCSAWASVGRIFAAAFLLAVVTMGFQARNVHSQELSLEERLASIPRHLADDIRQRVAQPPARRGNGRATALAVRTQDESESVTVRAVVGGVSATARCVEGYVDQRFRHPSAADVLIESEQLVDCDAGGCRAFQVIAKRQRTDPFNLDVSVTCTE